MFGEFAARLLESPLGIAYCGFRGHGGRCSAIASLGGSSSSGRRDLRVLLGRASCTCGGVDRLPTGRVVVGVRSAGVAGFAGVARDTGFAGVVGDEDAGELVADPEHAASEEFEADRVGAELSEPGRDAGKVGLAPESHQRGVGDLRKACLGRTDRAEGVGERIGPAPLGVGLLDASGRPRGVDELGDRPGLCSRRPVERPVDPRRASETGDRRRVVAPVIVLQRLHELGAGSHELVGCRREQRTNVVVEALVHPRDRSLGGVEPGVTVPDETACGPSHSGECDGPCDGRRDRPRVAANPVISGFWSVTQLSFDCGSMSLMLRFHDEPTRPVPSQGRPRRPGTVCPMRDSTSLFDHQEDSADDLTREFWGDKSAWVSDERRRSSGRTMQIRPADDGRDEYRLDHTPTSMRAVREGIAAFKPKRRMRDDSTGPVQRTRQHGVVTGATPAPVDDPAPRSPRRPSAETMAHSDASIADLGAGRYDYDDHAYDLSDLDEPIPARRSAASPVAHASARDAADRRVERDDDLVALTPVTFGDRFGLATVDPAVIRVGIVLLVLVLALPIALAMRGDDASGSELPGDTVPAAPQSVSATGAQPAAAENATPTPTAEATPAAAPADTAASSESTGESTDAAGVTESAEVTSGDAAAPAAPQQVAAARTAQADEPVEAAVASDEPAVVDEPAERITPDCSLNYTAGAGDSWYRIADEAGTTPADLLAQNMASLDTVILPGDEICLPAGSTVPTAPTTTVAPTTTEAPTTTAAPTTTQAPTTTAAPTTTVAQSETYSPAEVQALIRETWPEDQHEKALQVAWRESNYIETADNGWCCVGVFQIYWTVHQSWLDDYGIYTRDDLKNARKNIAAAYALYQSSGGWGPWGG